MRGMFAAISLIFLVAGKPLAASKGQGGNGGDGQEPGKNNHLATRAVPLDAAT
jgi:hypothetical protein